MHRPHIKLKLADSQPQTKTERVHVFDFRVHVQRLWHVNSTRMHRISHMRVVSIQRSFLLFHSELSLSLSQSPHLQYLLTAFVVHSPHTNTRTKKIVRCCAAARSTICRSNGLRRKHSDGSVVESSRRDILQ